MILQRIRIIVGEDAGFEPGTSVQEVLCATNEPPQLQTVCFIPQYSNELQEEHTVLIVGKSALKDRR